MDVPRFDDHADRFRGREPHGADEIERQPVAGRKTVREVVAVLEAEARTAHADRVALGDKCRRVLADVVAVESETDGRRPCRVLVLDLEVGAVGVRWPNLAVDEGQDDVRAQLTLVQTPIRREGVVQPVPGIGGGGHELPLGALVGAVLVQVDTYGAGKTVGDRHRIRVAEDGASWCQRHPAVGTAGQAGDAVRRGPVRFPGDLAIGVVR